MITLKQVYTIHRDITDPETGEVHVDCETDIVFLLNEKGLTVQLHDGNDNPIDGCLWTPQEFFDEVVSPALQPK